MKSSANREFWNRKLKVDNKPTVFVNLDTVIDMNSFQHFLEKKTLRHSERWANFFGNIPFAGVNQDNLDIVDAISGMGYQIAWSSGFPYRCQPKVEKWMRTHHVPGTLVFFRNADMGLRRSRVDVKRTHIWRWREKNPAAPIHLWIEDTSRYVKQVEEEALPVLSIDALEGLSVTKLKGVIEHSPSTVQVSEETYDRLRQSWLKDNKADREARIKFQEERAKRATPSSVTEQRVSHPESSDQAGPELVQQEVGS